MAHTTSAAATNGLIVTGPRVAKPSVFARILAAMQAARLRQAEREVSRYLTEAGGKFTDEAEREIERRFLSNRTHW